jgi:hypothetical protein
VPKKISRSQLIGNRGIALIDRRVGEMGCIWHGRTTDAGIDGQIELRDDSTGEMLGRLVLVQSKASDDPFAGEDDSGFHYVVRAADLEYWLAANAPVIVVCSHPQTQQAWFKSVQEWFSTPERRAARRIEFDKGADRFDASAAARLLRLTDGPQAPVYLGPPPVVEQLRSNLLPLVAWPDVAYEADCVTSDPRAAWELLRAATDDVPGDWRLRAGRLLTFRDPRVGALRHLLGGEPVARASDDLAFSDDGSEENAFRDLLSRTFQHQFRDELAWHRESKVLYFRGNEELEQRKVPGARPGAGVTVFKAYPRKKDETQVASCRHLAFGFRFARLDDAWFMAITPTYHFTFDGFRDFYWAADQLSGIKRRERNAAVRNTIDTIARFVRQEPDENLLTPLLGANRPLEFGDLVSFDVEFGLDDDSWRKPATESERGADRLFEDAA